MPDDLQILDTPLADALSERYLAYALSTITARSLPDVRDGLKPVHRRLLWAMHLLRLNPNEGFKKCARIVGDVMGKYHPHGDGAIYDTLVRLAQEFAARYPLIEGQGNFGNIDGDNPAAMRYTEARLTAVAVEMLRGIDEDAVDFRATYDGEDREPVVLPAGFPNLLANGAAGIAVGMATSIPPHNAGEVCSALLHLIAHPKASTVDLIAHMPGPDFATGGVLVEDPAAIREAYETGRGGFRVRARWHREELKGGLYRIIVTEIPPLVPKSRLIERIASLLEEKKLPLLADLADESTDVVRLVLEPRARTVEPAALMESLFRQTELETRFPLNMNVLDALRTPRVMALPEVLRCFLEHRHEVLVRRARHRLAAVERRIEVLEGYLAVYLNLDEVIHIIRTEDEPKPVLIATFTLTEMQAEAILNMRLRSLRRLEEMEIRKEHASLTREKKRLGKLLSSEPERWKAIAAEIEDIRTKFGSGPLGDRRTTIAGPPAPIDLDEALPVERAPVTIILSEKGWVRAMKGHLETAEGLKFKDGDSLSFFLHAESTDRLMLFGSNGRFYTVAAGALPGGRGDGQPMRLLVDLPNEDQVLAMFAFHPEGKLLVASSAGRGFVVKASDALAETRKGKAVLLLGEGEKAAVCVPAEGDHLATIGSNRKLLVVPLDQVPEMAKGRGVALQRFKDGGLADARVFVWSEGLAVENGGRVSVVGLAELREWRGDRAQAGKLPWRGFPRSGRFG